VKINNEFQQKKMITEINIENKNEPKISRN